MFYFNPASNYPRPCQMWLLTALLTCDTERSCTNTDARYLKRYWWYKIPSDARLLTDIFWSLIFCFLLVVLMARFLFIHLFVHNLHDGLLCAIVRSILTLVWQLVGSCTRQRETEALGIPSTSRNILSAWCGTCCQDRKGICKKKQEPQ